MAELPEIEAIHLSHAFGDTHALQDVSLKIHAGESVAIMGASGSGKSTLLHTLAGIQVPDSGEVWFRGEPLSGLADAERSRIRLESFGFVFQFADLVPELTLAENIALPLELLDTPRRHVKNRVSDLLGALALEHCQHRLPDLASGGERQRAAVARAIAHQPSVIFADEPTGALDSASGKAVLDLLLRGVRALNAALIMVTHDPLVASRCDRILTVHDGQLAS
ncbi:ABC transporter ATP-binding protein [Mycetocola saprophilus]|uniref:ABC transporter ATP-binding protein n=1 Tax=Mycetocola saprophilus TaxID=76636 RepID=UPI003BF35EC4